MGYLAVEATEMGIFDDEVEEEDENFLPPYPQIVPQMFYRYCGISQYSDSNQMLSQDDFTLLLRALQLDPLLDDFLAWFPKPQTVKVTQAYIDIEMFLDLFLHKFAQTI